MQIILLRVKSQGILRVHLKSESLTIAALKQHNTAERLIDMWGTMDAIGKKQVSVDFVFNVILVFLLNI